MESILLIDLLKAALITGITLGLIFALTSVLGKRQLFAVWIKRPFQFVAFSGSIWLFFRLAKLTGFERYAAALVVAAALGGIVHIIISFIFTVFFSRRRDIHLPPLLRNVILFFTYISILIVALKITVPGFSLSPLILASGVFSLVVGLALQDVLSNLIAGITLAIEKPLRKDDWVLIEGKEGKVVDITWRTTKILTRQNDYIIFPNRLVAERELRNYIYPSRLHRPFIEVGLPYSTLPSIAEEALMEAADKAPGVLKRPRPRVIIRDFDESSVTYALVVSIDDFDNYYLILSDIKKEIYYALKRYGVVIPFPIRTVYLHRGKPHPEEWKEPYRHRLQVLSGLRKGESFPLEGTALKIGRGEECEIDLRDPVTSKEHARIEFKDGAYFIKDMKSKHGTFVNDVKIDSSRLRSGDEIKIGESVLRFEEIDFS
ncbi:MAG: FHA domain-containing protein [Candidatus Glassbacteria bacterium]